MPVIIGAILLPKERERAAEQPERATHFTLHSPGKSSHVMLAITPSVQFFVSNGSSRTFQIRQTAPLSSSMLLPGRLGATRLQSTCRLRTRLRASLVTDPDAFEVGRFIGSYGFMNVTSYSGVQSGLGTSPEDIEKLKVQDVGEGSVKIRLYEGRLTRGPQRGISVILKVYPGQRAAGIEADMMATNELSAHAFLQSCSKDICQNLLILIGGFETSTGEQWLAFRRDGIYTAADYARIASKKWTNFLSSGQKGIWNSFEQEQMLKRRRVFVIRLLQGVMKGLAFMHDHDRLHQSLGPASVVLNTIAEREGVYLVPRLRDLAFSVDVRLSSVEETPAGSLARGLWRRAASAGAFDPFEKRAFAIADDIYEAGLLFAYLAFVPFCEAGIMDSLSLQRLIENTFQLDLGATREYCLADDRLVEAVKFLDMGDGAGWELLQLLNFSRNFGFERQKTNTFPSSSFLARTIRPP